MRRLRRPELLPSVQAELDRRQDETDAERRDGRLNIEVTWKAARQTKCLLATLAVLKEMAGKTERCMYCSDSHGTDIDHFRPKQRFPDRMFRWPNLLLCCAECGRFKGDKLPLERDEALFVDPTTEDPWQFLDFHPPTGNIVSRYDKQAGDWSRKGDNTVEILQLDRREALATTYRRAMRRLEAVVEAALSDQGLDEGTIIARLREHDDCGLLGWCFSDSGGNWTPFSELRGRWPQLWERCRALFCSLP